MAAARAGSDVTPPGIHLNRNIPGQMTDQELYRLMEIARAVPENGIIVEIGSLYGLSTWHLSAACKPSVTIFAIDPWRREQWIEELVEIPQAAPPFSFEAFQSFTRDCKNVVPIRGYSPDAVLGWKVPIDCYFDDAVHNNPGLRRNLDFWREWVKPGGTICGHDYQPYWPDVITEAHQLASQEGQQLDVIDTLWSLKTKTVTAGQIRAARALLGWDVGEMAKKAGVDAAAIEAAERAGATFCWSGVDVASIRRSFEAAGLELISEPGWEPGFRMRSRPGPPRPTQSDTRPHADDTPGEAMAHPVYSGRDGEAAEMIYRMDVVGLTRLPRCRPHSWAGAFQNDLLDHGAAGNIENPPAHAAALHAAVVMMVKNEEDIIGLNLRWLRRTGLRRFVVIENNSSDQTRSVLINFREQFPDCELIIVDDHLVRYTQSDKTTGACRLAGSIWPDVQWIFPIDADEFLIAQTNLDNLLLVPNDISCIVIPKAVHFRERGKLEVAGENIYGFTRAMALRSQLFFVPPKVAVRASPLLVVHQGNHSAVGSDGAELRCLGGLGIGFCYREFQTRSFAHFLRKAADGAAALRAADAHTGAEVPGHWRSLQDMVTSGGKDKVRELYSNFSLREESGGIVRDTFPLEDLLRGY